ncbi:hypothetical protein T484DRAFT_1760903 [Baffinella frigidus]|nr:hypothetical protein T484DRAFT_1760903 [Cryptophyta sp. CCMP2293]
MTAAAESRREAIFPASARHSRCSFSPATPARLHRLSVEESAPWPPDVPPTAMSSRVSPSPAAAEQAKSRREVERWDIWDRLILERTSRIAFLRNKWLKGGKPSQKLPPVPGASNMTREKSLEETAAKRLTGYQVLNNSPTT